MNIESKLRSYFLQVDSRRVSNSSFARLVMVTVLCTICLYRLNSTIIAAQRKRNLQKTVRSLDNIKQTGIHSAMFCRLVKVEVDHLQKIRFGTSSIMRKRPMVFSCRQTRGSDALSYKASSKRCSHFKSKLCKLKWCPQVLFSVLFHF
jgi:hypothetical protein